MMPLFLMALVLSTILLSVGGITERVNYVVTDVPVESADTITVGEPAVRNLTAISTRHHSLGQSSQPKE